ncbi:MAG: hypothetical protein KBI01_04650 [Oscillospiraceae bacterium]|nr:hypothetical protein [Oscillospiraceae bacterium]
MDEKEKEVLKEESGDSISAEAAVEVVEATEEKAEVSDESCAKINEESSSEEASKAVAGAAEAKKKLHKALVRVGVAFLAALLLLAVTKLSVVDLIKGAKESDSVQDEEVGTFVKRDVFAILGFFDAEAAADSETTATDATTDSSTTESLTPADSTSGEYALVPMGGKFVTVHFTKRYLDSAYAIEAQTYSYINGSASALDSYVPIEGTTKTISEDLSTQMYDWFALNKDWMVQAGVISDSDDNATYLSDVILEVDTVKGLSEALVYALTGLAAALVLYMIVELILMATGFYLNGPKKKKAESDSAEDTAGKDEETSAIDETTATEETSANEDELLPEADIKDEKTQETTETGEVSEEETVKSEIQEDK